MKSLNLTAIDDVEFDGINHGDYPDFCDAFICAAYWKDGSELSEAELDLLNEDSSFVYERLMEHLY